MKAYFTMKRYYEYLYHVIVTVITVDQAPPEDFKTKVPFKQMFGGG
jgi:hypothetical protein